MAPVTKRKRDDASKDATNIRSKALGGSNGNSAKRPRSNQMMPPPPSKSPYKKGTLSALKAKKRSLAGLESQNILQPQTAAELGLEDGEAAPNGRIPQRQSARNRSRLSYVTKVHPIDKAMRPARYQKVCKQLGLIDHTQESEEESADESQVVVDDNASGNSPTRSSHRARSSGMPSSKQVHKATTTGKGQISSRRPSANTRRSTNAKASFSKRKSPDSNTSRTPSALPIPSEDEDESEGVYRDDRSDPGSISLSLPLSQGIHSASDEKPALFTDDDNTGALYSAPPASNGGAKRVEPDLTPQEIAANLESRIKENIADYLKYRSSILQNIPSGRLQGVRLCIYLGSNSPSPNANDADMPRVPFTVNIVSYTSQMVQADMDAEESVSTSLTMQTDLPSDGSIGSCSYSQNSTWPAAPIVRKSSIPVPPLAMLVSQTKQVVERNGNDWLSTSSKKSSVVIHEDNAIVPTNSNQVQWVVSEAMRLADGVESEKENASYGDHAAFALRMTSNDIASVTGLVASQSGGFDSVVSSDVENEDTAGTGDQEPVEVVAHDVKPMIIHRDASTRGHSPTTTEMNESQADAKLRRATFNDTTPNVEDMNDTHDIITALETVLISQSAKPSLPQITNGNPTAEVERLASPERIDTDSEIENLTLEIRSPQFSGTDSDSVPQPTLSSTVTSAVVSASVIAAGRRHHERRAVTSISGTEGQSVASRNSAKYQSITFSNDLVSENEASTFITQLSTTLHQGTLPPPSGILGNGYARPPWLPFEALRVTTWLHQNDAIPSVNNDDEQETFRPPSGIIGTRYARPPWLPVKAPATTTPLHQSDATPSFDNDDEQVPCSSLVDEDSGVHAGRSHNVIDLPPEQDEDFV